MVKTFGRIVLFIIYFWFGILKLVGESPANPLVSSLLERTLPFITFDQFIIGFAIFEMLIGVLFLFPRTQMIATAFFLIHMLMTFAPLVLLPTVTWERAWVPTLEGQYILKNLALIAIVAGLGKSKRSH